MKGAVAQGAVGEDDCDLAVWFYEFPKQLEEEHLEALRFPAGTEIVAAQQISAFHEAGLGAERGIANGQIVCAPIRHQGRKRVACDETFPGHHAVAN